MTVKSNADTLITIFGGSGFLGRHVVRALAKRQYRVRVAVRRPDLAGHLQPLGRVGQIHAVQANIRHRASIAAAVRGSDVVINLVGILFESGRQRFDAVQSIGAEGVALAAAAHNARMIHISAIGADEDSSAAYARAKWRGEQRVLATTPDATIFRPSILFGPNDDFFNRFAGIARLSPALPLVGGGHTRFQPAFAGDVAEAIAKAVEGAARPGAIYELGGPDVFTFRELMEFVLATIERRRLLVPLPFGIAKLQAAVFEMASKLPLRFLSKPLLTRDQVELLRYDNVVSDAARDDGRTLDGLGISPQSVAAIVPTYLWRFRKAGQFHGHVGLI
ncbi:MAG TPA: complex I NDUFA9 subunit family protein [Xanthobacteraceae bacterium]|nr:complex I NDUFA9 subunit family protein [Xanthobacteraceae bacterium]